MASIASLFENSTYQRIQISLNNRISFAIIHFSILLPKNRSLIKLIKSRVNQNIARDESKKFIISCIYFFLFPVRWRGKSWDSGWWLIVPFLLLFFFFSTRRIRPGGKERKKKERNTGGGERHLSRCSFPRHSWNVTRYLHLGGMKDEGGPND